MTVPTLVNSRAAIPVQADRMMRLETRMTDLEARIATGERFTEPADAPPEALRAAMLTRMGQRLEADGRTLQRADSRLSAAETAATAATEILFRATELALLAANDALSDEDRAILRVEVGVLRQQLAEVANSRDDGGRHLFAGASGGAAFVADATGQWLWAGSGSGPGAEGAGLSGLANPTGPELFGSDTEGAFAALDALDRAMAEPDAEQRRAALDGSLLSLEASSNRLIGAHASIGARRARIEAETLRIDHAKLDLAKAQKENSGLDLTAAIAELSALELTLNAARAAFSRIHSHSLFDHLA